MQQSALEPDAEPGGEQEATNDSADTEKSLSDLSSETDDSCDNKITRKDEVKQPADDTSQECTSKAPSALPPFPLKGTLMQIRARFSGQRRRREESLHSTCSSGQAADRGELLVSDEDEGGRTPLNGTCIDAEFQAWQVVDNEGTVVAEDNAAEVSSARASVEVKFERMLTWMLTPAIHGIPKLSILSAHDRATEMLAAHRRDVEAAVCEVVAGSERSMSNVALNFCLERIPVLGCPAVLLRTTWGNLRSILIIAALYGHDLESARVQHEALLCLLPGEEKDAAASALRSTVVPGITPPMLVGATAQQVARMMIRGALRRATGFQAAVDCFELAALLYSSRNSDAVDEDGFVHVSSTPASAARKFFQRKSLVACALLWCSLPLLLLGMLSPILLAAARWAPVVWQSGQRLLQRLPFNSNFAFFVLLVGPCILFRLWETPARRKRRWFPGCTQLRKIVVFGKAAENFQEAWPQLVTTLVFLLHAILPAISTASSISVVLAALSKTAADGSYGWEGWDLMNRLACASLGIFSLLSVLTHQLQTNPEAESEDVPKFVRVSLRLLFATRAVVRSCCFLAAWAYLLIVFDVAAEQISQRWLLSTFSQSKEAWQTPLGVASQLAQILGAPRGSHPLNSEKSVGFCLNLVSALSQQRLVEVLSRREVLLRLIGAERVMASTICLLFKGVAVAFAPSKSENPIAEFLTRVAPPGICCVAIVAIRSQAVAFGAAFVLAPRVTSLFGSTPCFIVGSLAGAFLAYSFLSVWYTYRVDLDSAALRLAMLVPGGVSSQAKGLLRGVLVGARTRAVQMMAMGILQRALQWWWQKRL